MKRALVPLTLLTLAACSSAPHKPASSTGTLVRGHEGMATAGRTPAGGCLGRYAPVEEDPSTRGHYTPGGLYRPGVADSVPTDVPDVDCIAEPQVRAETLSDFGNRSPYTVLGKSYQVLDTQADYVEDGVASFYGQKFHGRKTSNHEVYDMYQFTAAHKTLPLPSFALVTNLDSGKSVVVRVNDRGPFHDGRLIDLSYAAAVKLGITARGTGRVEVRALHPDDPALPALLAGRGAAPVKTTIATGVPTRLTPASTTATSSPAPAQARTTAMDSLVKTLPATTPPTPASSPSTQAPAAGAVDGTGAHRYYSTARAGERPNADAFAAWMQANGVRVATGKPATAGAGTPATVATAMPASPAPLPAPPRPPAMDSSPARAGNGDQVMLQVASFSSRDNAQKALERLLAAGIDSASVSDTIRGGRTLWRLRVGADSTAADGLSGRIAALGFGQPQVVRE